MSARPHQKPLGAWNQGLRVSCRGRADMVRPSKEIPGKPDRAGVPEPVSRVSGGYEAGTAPGRSMGTVRRPARTSSPGGP